MKKSKKKKRFAVTAVFIGSIATIVAFLIVTFVNHGKSDNNENIIESTAGETSTQESESSKNVTSKGYKIENIDGVTYINNIMIVNKEYPLPRSYDPKDLDTTAYNAFLEMKKAAEADDIELWIQSGYRSYDDKKNYMMNQLIHRMQIKQILLLQSRDIQSIRQACLWILTL